MFPWQRENLIGINVVANNISVNSACQLYHHVNIEFTCLISIKDIIPTLGFIGETTGDFFFYSSSDPLAYFLAVGATQQRFPFDKNGRVRLNSDRSVKSENF